MHNESETFQCIRIFILSAQTRASANLYIFTFCLSFTEVGRFQASLDTNMYIHSLRSSYIHAYERRTEHGAPDD